jgi:hypothetical protein
MKAFGWKTFLPSSHGSAVWRVCPIFCLVDIHLEDDICWMKKRPWTKNILILLV